MLLRCLKSCLSASNRCWKIAIVRSFNRPSVWIVSRGSLKKPGSSICRDVAGSLKLDDLVDSAWIWIVNCGLRILRDLA